MTDFVVFVVVVVLIVQAVRRSGHKRLIEERFKAIVKELDDLQAKMARLTREHQELLARAAQPTATATATTPTAAAARSQPTKPTVPQPSRTAQPAPVTAPQRPPVTAPISQPAAAASAAAPTMPSAPAMRPAATQERRPAMTTSSPSQPSSAAFTPKERTFTPPSLTQTPRKPVGERMKSALAVEETLGANWLHKVGITLLVLGVVSLLIYQFGGTPAGKVILAVAASVAGLAGGIWLESRERYTRFARSLIGGAWALLYFTAYAVNHVAATHLLDSQSADLLLMLGVAAAMILHSLRYRAQAATTIAYLLAFTAVALSHGDVYSLPANAILTLSLVVIVARRRWFELEVAGIIAAYFAHFLWLMPLVESSVRPIPGAMASVALLIGYWAVFRISYVVRQVRSEREESVSTLAALLNSFSLLALLKYQAARPDLAFYSLLAFGATELVLARLVRHRRTAFLILSTIGVALVVAAIPFRYTGESLSLLWLVEAQVLVFAGSFTREVHFRRLGLLANVLAAGHIALQNWNAHLDPHRGILFAVAALASYFDAHVVPAGWPKLITSRAERGALRFISWIAAALASMAIGVTFREIWMPVAWMTLAFVLVSAGKWRRNSDLRVQALLIAAVAIVRVVIANANGPAGAWHGVTLRLITTAIVALAAYVMAPLAEIEELEITRLARAFYSTAGSLLVMLLVWNEAPAAWVVVGWIGLALALAIASRFLGWTELSVQAATISAVTMARIIIVNVAITALYQHLTIRLVTVGLVGVLYYLIALITIYDDVPFAHEFGKLGSWCGTFLVALLAWYELNPVSVVPAWTALALLLFELGVLRRTANLRFQTHVLLGAAFIRIFFVNLNASAAAGELSARLYTIAPLALAFFYVYFRMEAQPPKSMSADLSARAPQYHAWLAAATLAAILRFELAPQWVISGWAVLAALLVATACILNKRIFLHQAVVLAAAVVGRGIFYNIAERSYWQTAHAVPLTLGAPCLAMLLSLPFAFRVRAAEAKMPVTGVRKLIELLSRRPDQTFFFAPLLLLTVTLAFFVQGGMLTVAWGVEGVAVFLCALLVGQRSYRLSGLAILLLCVGKIIIMDVWELTAHDRYLTLIVLGAALLLVSFLYNKNRERLRSLL